MDVGAAPGGWTQFLARKGCRVVAIDPADVPDVPSGCRHLKDTAGTRVILRDETKRKRRRRTPNWCPFDVYVSDAVLHDADAQQNLLRGAVDAGLLRENAVIVVTFKSAPGRGVGDGYRRARARNRGTSCARATDPDAPLRESLAGEDLRGEAQVARRRVSS